MLKLLIIDLLIRDPYHFCLGKGNIYNYPEKSPLGMTALINIEVTTGF